MHNKIQIEHAKIVSKFYLSNEKYFIVQIIENNKIKKIKKIDRHTYI